MTKPRKRAVVAPPVAGASILQQYGFTAVTVVEVSKISFKDVSARALERTRHAILDWLGVTIAGASQPSARISRQVLSGEGGHQVARVIGTVDRMTARQAALAMGIASHAMDYDDIGLGGHPSVVILPAAFAVAEEENADGPTVIEAILHGYEMMDRVYAACGFSSIPRGFHSTGTFGAFGATMAVGRLLGLDALRLARAMGIAGSQASGLKASFGTMSKHLNAGNAAAVGVLSARLAEAGFTGATDVIESPQGFAIAHNADASDFDQSRPSAATAGRLAVENITFKLHAACGGTHGAIDGIHALKERHGFSLDDVKEVELIVSDLVPGVCNILEPETGVEGMFSLRHAAALALTDTPTGPAGFTDERVCDPALVAARSVVRVVPTIGKRLGFDTDVVVRLKTGEVLETSIVSLAITPDEQLEKQWDSLEAKFHELVEPILGIYQAKELVGLVRRIETLKSVRDLTGAAAPR